MEALWNGAEGSQGYWAKVLTAYAAARVPASAANADSADGLIAAMLAAGLDRDAISWKPLVAPGSEGWALIVLADPQGGAAGAEALDAFADDDASTDARKSQFLIAGLAGLERISAADRSSFESRLSLDLEKQTRPRNSQKAPVSSALVSACTRVASPGEIGPSSL